MKFQSFEEARNSFAADRAEWASRGIVLPAGTVSYLPESFRHNDALAMDAMVQHGLAMDTGTQPGLTTEPNASIPSMLTTFIDPDIFEVLFTPLNIAEIYGETKKGGWTDDTAAFPVVEQTGEVSTYGDRSNNGRAGVNMNWPDFQQYRYQTIITYGDLEMQKANLGKINYVSELQKSAASQMNRYENTVYAFGVSGLQNYGALNNPYLAAPLTPSTKVAGGTSWDDATANEIFDDIQDAVTELISQLGGLINTKSKMTLALSPKKESQLSRTNSFAVNVSDLIKKNYPSMRVVTAVQFGAKSAQNPQGNAAGELMQVVADDVEGQKTGTSAFSEKLRAHPIIVELSAWKQKRSAGTWGTILRMPVAVAQMVGI